MNKKLHRHQFDLANMEVTLWSVRKEELWIWEENIWLFLTHMGRLPSLKEGTLLIPTALGA